MDTSAGRFGASGGVGHARFDLTLGLLLLRLSRPFTGRPNTGRRPPLPRGGFHVPPTLAAALAEFADRVTAPELEATGLPVFPTRRCDQRLLSARPHDAHPSHFSVRGRRLREVHTTTNGGIRTLFAPSRFSEDCYVGGSLAVIANTGETIMMPATSLQSASVATAPQWCARLRLDSGLARPCGAAAGPAVTAKRATGGNQR